MRREGEKAVPGVVVRSDRPLVWHDLTAHTISCVYLALAQPGRVRLQHGRTFGHGLAAARAMTRRLTSLKSG